MGDSNPSDDDRLPGGTQISVTVILGAVLLVAGIAGVGAGERLLVFGVNAVHNAVHALTGVLAVAAGLYRHGVYADEFNKTAGVVYAALVVFQLVAPGVAATLLNAGTADLWLHVLLALAFGGVGFALPDRDPDRGRAGEPG